MWKKILLGIVVVIVVLAAIIAMQPNTFSVSRSVTIAAPPAVVFAQVNDFHKWGAWSPWEKMDPGMKRTYEGAAAGQGAVYSWDGNSKVGAGRMTVDESKPNELVHLKLEFFRPMAGTNMGAFAFKAEGNQTTVTWSMSGPTNFVSKAFGLVVSMDKMIGGEFDKGLAQLKAVSEASK